MNFRFFRFFKKTDATKETDTNRRVDMMKKLVVGQDVYMISGVYGGVGKVVAVMPDGYVEVRPAWADRTIRFSPRDGESCDGTGTFECGPWVLDDMSFEERTAEFERKRRENAVRDKLIAEGVEVSEWEDWQAYKRLHPIE